MSTEPLGIVSDLQERRSAMVANLSPAARHAAFPDIYRQPAVIAKRNTVQEEIAALKNERDALLKTEASLRTANKRLSTELAAVRSHLPMKNSPAVVISVFLDLHNMSRIAVGAQPWTMAHLASPCRARDYTMPRHVAMWLVRQISTHYSLPMIAKVFGNRDHTTALHALSRAPHWLALDANLKAAADATLARFSESKEAVS